MIRVLAGAAAAIAARAAFTRALLFKLRRDLARLNAGDYRPLLSGFAEDAVLLFYDGDHRWAGEHRGKPAIERFLKDFTAAGIQGEIKELHVTGPPWAFTAFVRFDDGATGAGGEQLYRNRVVLLLRTRWGKVVRQEDFFEDTGRIDTFERRLRELGMSPAA